MRRTEAHDDASQCTSANREAAAGGAVMFGRGGCDAGLRSGIHRLRQNSADGTVGNGVAFSNMHVISRSGVSMRGANASPGSYPAGRTTRPVTWGLVRAGALGISGPGRPLTAAAGAVFVRRNRMFFEVAASVMPDIERLDRIAAAFADIAARQTFPTGFHLTRLGRKTLARHTHTGKWPEFDAAMNDAVGALGFKNGDAFIAWVFERCPEFVESEGEFPAIEEFSDGSKREVPFVPQRIANAARGCEQALRREIELIRRESETKSGGASRSGRGAVGLGNPAERDAAAATGAVSGALFKDVPIRPRFEDVNKVPPTIVVIGGSVTARLSLADTIGNVGSVYREYRGSFNDKTCPKHHEAYRAAATAVRTWNERWAWFAAQANRVDGFRPLDLADFKGEVDAWIGELAAIEHDRPRSPSAEDYRGQHDEFEKLNEVERADVVARMIRAAEQEEARERQTAATCGRLRQLANTFDDRLAAGARASTQYLIRARARSAELVGKFVAIADGWIGHKPAAEVWRGQPPAEPPYPTFVKNEDERLRRLAVKQEADKGSYELVTLLRILGENASSILLASDGMERTWHRQKDAHPAFFQYVAPPNGNEPASYLLWPDVHGKYGDEWPVIRGELLTIADQLKQAPPAAKPQASDGLTDPSGYDTSQRPILNKGALTVLLDGASHLLSDDGFAMVEKLLATPGQWVGGSVLKSELEITRPDQTKRRGIPNPVSRHIESHTVHGYRWID